jgi:hypothetical protein
VFGIAEVEWSAMSVQERRAIDCDCLEAALEVLVRCIYLKGEVGRSSIGLVGFNSIVTKCRARLDAVVSIYRRGQFCGPRNFHSVAISTTLLHFSISTFDSGAQCVSK